MCAGVGSLRWPHLGCGGANDSGQHCLQMMRPAGSIDDAFVPGQRSFRAAITEKHAGVCNHSRYDIFVRDYNEYE
jgi:hypothetical protein